MKKYPQILILIGAPGSGKSTFAKYFIRTEECWMRLCRDDFRAMNFENEQMSLYEENLLTEMMDAVAETLLRKGYNVLMDATHCRAEYLNHYIEKFNTFADISFKLFDIDINELITRCDKRYETSGKFIAAGVIKRFVKDLNKLKKTFDFSPRPAQKNNIELAQQDENLPKAIICDLDGTLALMHNRDPYDASNSDEDKLNVPVAHILKNFAAQDYRILLVSGREEKFREPTLRFLEKHAIPYQRLFMRKSGDYRKDAIVKREIFDAEIAGNYFVELALDDRNQVVDMWRKDLKLNCFQVNYGDF